MIAGVFLAAGAARRFGADKLLSPLADGTPIAVQSARNLRLGVERVIAVVRPDDHELAALLRREGLDVIACTASPSGMGSSLAFGVQAASDAAGWLIVPADMPFIRPGTIRTLAMLIQSGAAIAAPEYMGRRGHPVGFNAEYFSALVVLAGDTGARPLIDAQRCAVQLFTCDDPGVLMDIDTPDDLAAAMALEI